MSSWIPTFFNSNTNPDASSSTPNLPETLSSGVKKDLSAVFRGVAEFLGPPPISEASSSSSSDAIAGVKNDLAEIRGSLKSGLSFISSKLSNNFSHLRVLDDDDYALDEEEEDEEEEAVGITENVVDFVKMLCKRPELWNDFPLSLSEDFNLSDLQEEHAANIDYLVPELTTLRQKIDSQISDGKFWMIYFILLLPRFKEADSKLLSTPEVVNARDTLLMKLEAKSSTVLDTSETLETSELVKDSGKDYVPEINKSSSADISEENVSGVSLDAHKESENEVISFSGLEDDDSDLSEKIHEIRTSNSSRGEASEWIQLHETSGSCDCPTNIDQSTLRDKESEGEDSVDWLAIDDKDFDNMDAD